MNHARVQHNSHQPSVTECVAIGAEDLRVRRETFGRGLVLHIMVAGDVVDGNGAIDFSHDAPVLGNLCSIARLVHQVARDYHERRLQPVHRGHREFKVRRILGKIPVVGEHPELRIAQLNEEERLLRRHHAGTRERDEAQYNTPKD